MLVQRAMPIRAQAETNVLGEVITGESKAKVETILKSKGASHSICILLCAARPCHDRFMLERTAQLGPLTCRIVDSAASAPEALVVLCHGYGASGNDLLGLAQSLVHQGPQAPVVRFIFPEGPLSLKHLHMPHGRAWWHLDVDMLRQRSEDAEGFAQSLRKRLWPGLADARKQLRQLVDEALMGAKLGYDRLVLGGFSQGAMLTTDLALRLDEAPGGLMVLSGSLADESNWQRLMARRSGLRVVVSHGQSDPVLPYGNAVALKDLMAQHGALVRFVPFSGGHTIVPEALLAGAELIDEVLGRPGPA